MIRHLRYLGLLLPLFTFSSGRRSKIPLSISPPPEARMRCTGQQRTLPVASGLILSSNQITKLAFPGLMSPLSQCSFRLAYASGRPAADCDLGSWAYPTRRPAGAGHPRWRRCLLPGGRQTLARGGTRQRNDALAITGIVDGKSVNWMEKVTDEQYHAH